MCGCHWASCGLHSLGWTVLAVAHLRSTLSASCAGKASCGSCWWGRPSRPHLCRRAMRSRRRQPPKPSRMRGLWQSQPRLTVSSNCSSSSSPVTLWAQRQQQQARWYGDRRSLHVYKGTCAGCLLAWPAVCRDTVATPACSLGADSCREPSHPCVPLASALPCSQAFHAPCAIWRVSHLRQPLLMASGALL